MTTTLNQPSAATPHRYFRRSHAPLPTFNLQSMPTLWNPLHRLAKRGRTQTLLRAGFYSLSLALAGLLLLVLLRLRYPQLPYNLGLGLWSTYWLVLTFALLRWIRPAWRAGTVTHAIHHAEQTDPRLQERLSSVVELLSEPDPRYRGSPELIAHLVRQAQAEAQQINPEVILPARSLRLGMILFFSAIVLWLFIGLARPEIFGSALKNSLMPWNAANLMENNGQPTSSFPWTVTPGSCQMMAADPLLITVEAPNAATALQKSASASPSPPPAIRGLTLITHLSEGQNLAYPMIRTGTSSFQYPFEHVTQGFSYEIQSIPENAQTAPLQSARFTVTVLPRPEIQNLTIRYDYPPYTHLPSRLDNRNDGNIDAPVNTRITFLLTPTQPISARSHLLLHPDSPQPYPLKLTPVLDPPAKTGTPLATAALLLENPGDFFYRPMLFSATSTSTTSQQERTRKIHVTPDAPPVIKIISPAPELRLRPDETVPVQYEASDDYGLIRLQARVQIDQTVPETIDLPLPPAEQPPFPLTNARGTWPLKISDWLTRKDLTTAQRLTYQLKVMDNTPPKLSTSTVLMNAGQETLTPVYTLILDPKASPLVPPPPATSPATQPTLTPAQRKELEDLAQTLKQLAEKQQALAERSQQRAKAEQAAKSAEQIAKEQEKLNQEIKDFISQETEAGRDLPADLKPLEPAQLDNIVKNLKENKLATANEAQESAAKKLESTAPSSTAPANNPATKQNELTPEERQARTQAIQKLQEKTDKLAREIQQAQNQKHPPTHPNDPANETARTLANQTIQQARELATQDPAQKPALQQAVKEAQAAKEAANKGKAEEAQQHLKNATQQLAQSNEKSNAAPAPTEAEKKSAAEAEQQARKQADSLAERQRQLAKQTKSAAESNDQAPSRNKQAQTDETTQKRVSEQSAQTAERVRKLQQQVEQTAPDAAKKLGETGKNMENATAAQEAQDQPRPGDPTTPGQNQQKAAEQLGQSAKGLQQIIANNPPPALPSGVTPGQPNESGTASKPTPTTPGNPTPGATPAPATDPNQGMATGTPHAAPDTKSPNLTPAPNGTSSLPPAGNGPSNGARSAQSPTPSVSAAAQPLTPPEDLGISPGDWAKLSPDTKQQFLHASRQPGPPEYQELIKNYFVRSAQIQSLPTPPAPAKETAP